MNRTLPEAWAAVARLQNARKASTSETAVGVFDLLIDRQLDRIAADQRGTDDLAECRRSIATAARRERHRTRLLRQHFELATGDRSRIFVSIAETSLAARQTLNIIFSQTSHQDRTLLLSVAQGDGPRATGLQTATARQRLSRIRARFSDLRPQAA
jgi:hypothetical protein